MKPVTRTILMCRVQTGKKMALYPVAVFPSPERAKGHAAFLHIAYRSGDTETVKHLDPSVPLDEEGKLYPGAKWSVTEVPYDPTADFSHELDSLTEPSATV